MTIVYIKLKVDQITTPKNHHNIVYKDKILNCQELCSPKFSGRDDDNNDNTDDTDDSDNTDADDADVDEADNVNDDANDDARRWHVPPMPLTTPTLATNATANDDDDVKKEVAKQIHFS